MTPEQREELKPCPFCGVAAQVKSNRDWHRLYADHDEDCVLYDMSDLLMFPAQPGYLKEIADLWNRRAQVEALTVPQWISVEDEVPDHGQTVAFVVDSEDWELMRYLHGRVLGGKYDADSGNFSVPGLGLIASYWKPMDAAPTIPAIPGTKEGS